MHAVGSSAKRAQGRTGLGFRNANARLHVKSGVLYRALAMTYFLTGNPQYHRRGVVSRSCSGWEGVGPTRYGREEFWKKVVHWTRYCIVCLCTSSKVIESSRTGN